MSVFLGPSANPELIVYISKWIGDYHAPRLISLSEHAELVNKRLKVLQLNSKSKFYSHSQTRRDKLIKRLDFLAKPCASAREEAVATWAFLMTNKPDRILVLGYNDAISLTAASYALIFRKKIYFFSDSKADDQPRRRSTEIVKRLVLKLFDGAMVAGERHAEYFRSLGLHKEITTPYDVVDNLFFHKRSKFYKARGSKVTSKVLPDKYVLCVSRLVKRKRVDLALDVFARSGLSKLGYTFLLVGDGPEQAEIEGVVKKLDLTDSFRHCSNVPNHRMPAVYGSALAIVLASEYDQWGLCINEAMACGISALVTPRCGVANEIVTSETGFIFDTDTAQDAADHLSRLANDDGFRKRISEKCLQHMKNFEVDDFAAGVLKLMR